ncbi:DTW domain-containing protein YfiP [Marinobacter daqiaonensis]|uniref:tRNA-uridine aminocarboxypropyltransferase n=1 Tax=Marinobacter daqiaonensis TaxID=650891 RepID=A0A1I6GHY7_9GAMM|nr:tRNA-uridine aminocarboxypropyltransferase [Marinobacter daqiaonensis]SFR41798.1 DTW domain-containing protein YfiP [Marinobacter daqiaonensis]
MRAGLCPYCGVHQRICVCDVCGPIEDAPPLWALQHPTEVSRSKGTLRLAQACLPSMKVLVGESGSCFEPLASRGVGGLGLVFPHPGSEPLESADTTGVREWVVLDGTWRKARRMFLSNPWLQRLPAFHFRHPPASGYHIRKAPRADSLATAEALAYLLAVVRPGLDLGPLERAMAALVSRQLAVMPTQVRGRYGVSRRFDEPGDEP